MPPDPDDRRPPEPEEPPDLRIEPATSCDDARRAQELIREHGLDELLRPEE